MADACVVNGKPDRRGSGSLLGLGGNRLPPLRPLRLTAVPNPVRVTAVLLPSLCSRAGLCAGQIKFDYDAASKDLTM